MPNLVTRETALQKAAQKLDISPSKYKQAMDRFQSMKTFLENGEYEGCTGSPEVYLQGSFKLGTEIRPFINSQDADYDIDLVCRLEKRKSSTTPKDVKNLVGDKLKSSDRYCPKMDTEGKRCWTLNYAEQDGVGFHMDILPAVKEEGMSFLQFYYYEDTIAITDKKKDTNSYAWKPSNPRGFAKWFYEKNGEKFRQIKNDSKRYIYESYRADSLFESVDSVPDIFVKTPLQRAIQLLKRHRDMRFAGLTNENCKPISMIISVLSAEIYNNEDTIYNTLKNILTVLDRHSHQNQETFRFDESMIGSAYTLIQRDSAGEWHIPNPTCDGENFADRWRLEENGIKHARAKAFFDWVKWAKNDFLSGTDFIEEDYFVGKYGYGSQRPSNNLPSIFNVSHRQRPEEKWEIQKAYNASITASYNKNGWQVFPDQSTRFAIQSGASVPVKKSICFKAVTDFPHPYEVHWQVVNTGPQAQNAGCLRGDFYSSNGECAIERGKKTRVEPTAYIGDHWVQCFIVRNNICVAMSEPFVVRIR